MTLYPLRLAYSTSRGPLFVNVAPDPQGWTFANAIHGRELFQRLPVSERLELRRDFAAQVALANNTPTEGGS